MERRGFLIDLRRRAVASVPTSALAAMFLGGFLALLLSASTPLTPQAPVHLFEVCALVCAVAAPALFFLGERWRHLVLPPAVLIAIGLLATVVATVRTDDGTALSVFTFQWLAVYLAYFLPWRVAGCYMAVAMVALNIALIENQTHWERHARGAITVSFVAIFMLLARLVYRLRVQANTDQLTGLFNRNGVMDAAGIKVPKALRRGLPVTLCLIDLDNFKAVNDKVGHSGADRLLVALARHWQSVLPEGTILARFGGDEFMLICCDCAVESFDAILEAMRESSPLVWSAGFAPLRDLATIDDAIERADTMLYAVKAERRAAEEVRTEGLGDR